MLEYSPSLVLISIIIWLLLVATLNRSKKYPFCTNRTNWTIALLLGVLYTLFSFANTDWYHYQSIFQDLTQGHPGHMEEIYVWIAQNLCFNYLSFRFIVFSGAFIVFIYLIKKLHLNKHLSLFLFSAIWINTFVYARASLGMILAYLGVCILSAERKNHLPILMGVSILIFSYFFHKSSLFAISLSLVAYASIKLHKNLFITFFCIFLLLFIVLLPSLVTEVMSIDSNVDEFGSLHKTIYSGQRYLQHERGVRGLGAVLLRVLEITPYYLITLQCIRFHSSRIYDRASLSIVLFIRLQMIIVAISTVISFIPSLNTDTVFIRFIRFAAIPSVIALAYFWQNKQFPILGKCAFRIGLLASIYWLFYSFYISILA